MLATLISTSIAFHMLVTVASNVHLSKKKSNTKLAKIFCNSYNIFLCASLWERGVLQSLMVPRTCRKWSAPQNMCESFLELAMKKMDMCQVVFQLGQTRRSRHKKT